MADVAFTVSELNEFLKIAFDNSEILRDVYVKGEISNFTNHFKTGHYYFTLKDNDSALKAVMFRMYTRNIDFVPQNGMKVIAHGKIDVFVRDGTYSIKVDDIIPEGVGSVYLSFEQLKTKLEKEGLFDAEHKKPIPEFPQKIGIITSPTGAVIRDIQNVSSRRYPLCELVVYPCSVQGENAPNEIINGLKYFDNSDVDTVIIARGGGSIEDLSPFNNEKLARAIFACGKPIVSAVGHETDFTICDFVSDLRAPTPSAAAELALPSSEHLSSLLVGYEKRFTRLMNEHLDRKVAQLSRLSENYVFSKPFAALDNIEKTLSELLKKLNKNAEMLVDAKSKLFNFESFYRLADKIVDEKSRVLSEKAGKIEALSPLAVLSRGYSVVYKNGAIIDDANELKAKDEITICMSNGSVKAEVK